MKKVLQGKEKEIWLKNLKKYIKKIDNDEFKISDMPAFTKDYFMNYGYEDEGHILLAELRKRLDLIRKIIANYYGCKEDEIVIGNVDKETKNEDGKKIIFGDVDMYDADPYVDMFDFSQIQVIAGSAEFNYSDKIDLSNLSNIGGNASFVNSEINDLPMLKNIGGDAFFDGSEFNDLPMLENIGGDANFSYANIKSLSMLKNIGGDAIFSHSQITNLNSLQKIGGTADFRKAEKKINLSRLEAIEGDAFFYDTKNNDLKNLKYIGGDASFVNSEINDLPMLKNIGGEADFIGSPITSLKNLVSIGKDADFQDSQITNLHNLQKIGGNADFSNTNISDLGKLQEVSGGVINYNHQTIDLKTLKKIVKKKAIKDLLRNDLSHPVSEEEIIKDALKANIPIFLHGKPGSGKSDRVRQLDPDFIELNLGHLDPELLDGIAGEKDGKAIHIKPPWLDGLEEKCKQEPESIHILFLEELTNASPLMQSKAYGIVLDKKVAGKWKLPDNVRVVAAGNEIEDSLAANEMAEPLYDRFAHVNIETDAESWLKWAVTPDNAYKRIEYEKPDEERPKIHPAIYMFISYKGDEALRTPYDREHPAPHADPRRWKMASDMLYASNNPQTLKAIVGEELTQEFMYFCKMPKITIDDVLAGNYNQEVLDQMDIGEKLAIVIGLLPVDEDQMPKVRNFVKRLGPEICKKFDVQWAGGNEERLEQIQELTMKEKEEKNKMHSGEETRNMAKYGIDSYYQIDNEYKQYLSKEKNKENQSR